MCAFFISPDNRSYLISIACELRIGQITAQYIILSVFFFSSLFWCVACSARLSFVYFSLALSIFSSFFNWSPFREKNANTHSKIPSETNKNNNRKKKIYRRTEQKRQFFSLTISREWKKELLIVVINFVCNRTRKRIWWYNSVNSQDGGPSLTIMHTFIERVHTYQSQTPIHTAKQCASAHWNPCAGVSVSRSRRM